ncbi:hypothetical protein Syun_007177 [Stephania yunnanensis]|uniref:Uncharacterized protein n=1 Tax=Stephania yunnanensis TaxID=152371 RepID=A0AAP0KY55_9MAGN
MVDRRVSSSCYMNGDMVDGPSGISYTKPPIRHLRSKMGLGYDELVRYICNSLQIDNDLQRLNMTYRYPAYIGSGSANYVPLRIDDESSLKDAWDFVAELPPPHCMDLYIDLVPRQPYNSSNCNVVLHSGAGPSTQPIYEHSHCASPLTTANPEMDEDPHSCDDLNTSEDDDYCGSDGDTSEDSSEDDTGDEGDDGHHVDDGMIRYTLNRVIADDGSLSCPPISKEIGNDDFFDEEAAGIDGAPVGVGEFVVPSAVFMELSSEAMQPLHENAMPSRSLWNEASEFEKGMRSCVK